MEIVTQRRELQKHVAHLDRIRNMKAHIEFVFFTNYIFCLLTTTLFLNSTSMPTSLGLKHLIVRAKKQQLVDDRRQEIAKENRKLMENMAKV